jgi:hypothetical protein
LAYGHYSIYISNCQNVFITNCSFSTNGTFTSDRSLWIADSNNITVQGVDFNSYSAVEIVQCSDVTFDSNIINSTMCGIGLQSAKRISIMGNHFMNAYYNIYSYFPTLSGSTTDVQIVGNNFSETGAIRSILP